MPPVAAKFLGIFDEKTAMQLITGVHRLLVIMLWQLYLSCSQPFATSLATFGKCRGDGAE